MKWGLKPRPPESRGRGSDPGIALLLVLLIIAVVGTLSVETQYLTRIDAQVAANVALDTQFYYLAKSGVEAARSVLAEDRRDNAADSTTDTWAAPIAFPIEGALVSLDVVDEERKFPLNALVKRAPDAPQEPAGGEDSREPPVDQALFEAFDRLLATKEIPIAIAAKLVDWLDPDDERFGPDGAEIDVYESLKPPYRTKNGPLNTLEELRMVQGFDADVFRRIADLVTVYSPDGKININTASRDVLAALLPEADHTVLDELIEHRDDGPFETIDHVKEYLAGFGTAFGDGAAASARFRVNSFHFTIQSAARLVPTSQDQLSPVAETVKVLRAVVRRGDDGATEIIYWRAT